MELLPQERILAKPDGPVVLTTHRLRYETDSRLTSFLLEEVCSSEFVFEHSPRYAAWAALLMMLAWILGAVGSELRRSPRVELVIGTLCSLCFVFALGLLIGYVFSRRTYVRFQSAGATMEVQLYGAAKTGAREFIHQVEAAKNIRHMEISRAAGAASA